LAAVGSSDCTFGFGFAGFFRRFCRRFALSAGQQLTVVLHPHRDTRCRGTDRAEAVVTLLGILMRPIGNEAPLCGSARV
jgi:hypothetical protein